MVCEDSAITINDASLTSPAPAVEAQYPVTYLWTIVSGNNIGSISNDTTLVPTFTADGAGASLGGVVVLRLTATLMGIFHVKTLMVQQGFYDIQITVNPLPTVAASSGVPTQDFCEPEVGFYN